MVKLTSEVISHGYQYMNVTKEYELSLRGFKIINIQNLSATNDQFACINLSDNSISEIISHGYQYMNVSKEYELSLRGFKIISIQNLSATNDQFACINLTDNSISEINMLPQLKRLKTLMLINNRISKVEKDFAINCPFLTNLVLTNNKISDFEQIDNIASCKSLEKLYLLDNVVTKLKNYRLYVIYKIPTLRILDFQRVTKKEREEAFKKFSTI